MQEDLLVKRSLGGDKNAFEQLVLLYERNIYNIASLFTRSRSGDGYDAGKLFKGLSVFG